MAKRIGVAVGIITAAVLVAVVDRIALFGTGGLHHLIPVGVVGFRGCGRRRRRLGRGGRAGRSRVLVGHGSGRAGADILIPDMLRDCRQGGAVVLRNIAVGADITEQRIHRRTGQVDAVACFHIPALGIAGIRVLEGFGAVEEFPSVFFAHCHKAGVVFVNLGLGQALVRVLLAERRDRVDNDIDTWVGFDNGLDALLIVGDEVFGAVARRKVVCAKGQDHPLRLHQRNSFGHRLVIGVTGKLHAGIGGKAAGRHANRPNRVVIAAVVKHAVHSRCVRIPQKQRFINIFLPRIFAFLQNGRSVLRGIDGVFVLVVAGVFHQRFTGSGSALRLCPGGSQAVHHQKRDHNGQQHQSTADGQHKMHASPAAPAGPERSVASFSSCHSMLSPFLVPGPSPPCSAADSLRDAVTDLFYTIFPQCTSVLPIFTCFAQKWLLPGRREAKAKRKLTIFAAIWRCCTPARLGCAGRAVGETVYQGRVSSAQTG